MSHLGDGASEHTSVRGTEARGGQDDGHRDQRRLTPRHGGALRGVGFPEHQLRSPRVTRTSILWGGGQGRSGNLSVWEFSSLDSWCHRSCPA